MVFPDSYSATFAREACSASSPPPFDLALCTSATPVRFNFCVRARASDLLHLEAGLSVQRGCLSSCRSDRDICCCIALRCLALSVWIWLRRSSIGAAGCHQRKRAAGVAAAEGTMRRCVCSHTLSVGLSLSRDAAAAEQMQTTVLVVPQNGLMPPLSTLHSQYWIGLRIIRSSQMRSQPRAEGLSFSAQMKTRSHTQMKTRRSRISAHIHTARHAATGKHSS